jgi:hypothetical protein
MRHIWLAGAIAAAALLFTGAVPRPAEALPLSKPAITKDSGVTLVRRGGRGGGHRGGMRSFRGGGHHGFHRGGGRRFRGHIGRHRGHVGRRHFRGRKHHRGRRRYYPRYYGYVPYVYDYYYYDDGSCAWLRRKALRTGRRYWWRRYRRCLRYYD